MTIILVTHQMNDVADYADHALVLEHGRLIADTTPKALFSKPEWLREHHLDLPQTTKFAEKLMASGMKFDSLPLTKRELAQILADRIKGVLQMNKLLLGRYVNGDSLVHRMDARSKLVLSFYFVAIIFLCNNWQTYLLLAAFVLMCVKFSDLGIGFFIKGVKPLLGLIVFTVLLQVFFTRGGHVYWAFGPLSLTHFGIVNGFYVFCRFVLIIFMSTLLTLTTAPLEISDAIESLLKPLKAIKVPVYEISLMLSIALRFVPTLMDETEKIMNAQRSRGVNFSEGTLMQRIKAVIPLLIPLFVSSFNRAEELATAMEARGYRGGEGRTKYRVQVWTKIDTIAVILFAIVTILLFVLRKF